MPKRINSILLLSAFVVFLSGCSVSKIPADYRYGPRGLKREISGSWAVIQLNSKDIYVPVEPLSGELIAAQPDTIYLLTDVGMKALFVSDIKDVVLYKYMNYTGMYAGVTVLMALPDIIAAIAYGEPAFLLLDVPWVLAGTIYTITEGSNHLNLVNYTYPGQLPELKKYSRFPQGMPQGIDRSRLHLIKTN
jgi:hypothetical protein